MNTLYDQINTLRDQLEEERRKTTALRAGHDRQAAVIALLYEVNSHLKGIIDSSSDKKRILELEHKLEARTQQVTQRVRQIAVLDRIVDDLNQDNAKLQLELREVRFPK